MSMHEVKEHEVHKNRNHSGNAYHRAHLLNECPVISLINDIMLTLGLFAHFFSCGTKTSDILRVCVKVKDFSAAYGRLQPRGKL